MPLLASPLEDFERITAGSRIEWVKLSSVTLPLAVPVSDA